MRRRTPATALRLDFGEMPFRKGLRLATPFDCAEGSPSRAFRGAEKYRILDLKRRRAQIRARRALRLI
jgi:hypothetical protein